jgi:hypothetical protein
MNRYILLGIIVISVPGILSSNIISDDFENDVSGSGWQYYNNKNIEGPEVVEDPTYGVHGHVLQLNSCSPFVLHNVSPPSGDTVVSFDTLGIPMQGFSNGNTIAWMVRDQKYKGSAFSTYPPYDSWQSIQYPLSYQNPFEYSSIFFGSSPAEVEGDCRLTYVDNIRIQEKSETSSNLNTSDTQLTWYLIIASFFVILVVGTGLYLKMKSQRRSLFYSRAIPDRSSIDFMKLFEAGKWTDYVKVLRFDELLRTEQLGEGNSSEVWAYKHHASIVAGKRLKTGTHTEGKVGGTYMANSSSLPLSSSNRKTINLFEWEMFVIKTVGRHDNIIPLTGRVMDPQIVVLFHMPSKSVYDYMTVNQVCLEDKLRIAQSVAAGLVHLHYERLIHRDIALRNILLGRLVNGRINKVVISDFEISKFLLPSQSSSFCDSNYGPIALMAPEAFNKEYSPQTDIYMFSMLLYSLFTQEMPWRTYIENENHLALMSRVREGHRPKLSWDEDAFPGFTNIIKTCWNQTPSLRTNMSDILDRLNLIQLNELPPPPSVVFLGGLSSYSACDV